VIAGPALPGASSDPSSTPARAAPHDAQPPRRHQARLVTRATRSSSRRQPPAGLLATDRPGRLRPAHLALVAQLRRRQRHPERRAA
jgi:hypothetical protein